MKTQLIFLFLILSFFSVIVHAQSAAEAKQAVERAQKLWNKTIEVGHEWNTIKPLVAQAKQALRSNDYAKAIALANKGSLQSEQAIIQSEHEKTNWVHNLPK